MTPADERETRRRQRIANRVAAMQAVLKGDPDAVAWLKATGMTPEVGCECPFCKPAA